VQEASVKAALDGQANINTSMLDEEVKVSIVQCRKTKGASIVSTNSTKQPSRRVRRHFAERLMAELERNMGSDLYVTLCFAGGKF